MKQFTYYDYLEYRKIELVLNRQSGIKIQKIIGLMEEPVEYKYIEKKNKEINNKHDKIFRMGLDNSKEVAKFISEKIDLELKIKRRIIRKIQQ